MAEQDTQKDAGSNEATAAQAVTSRDRAGDAAQLWMPDEPQSEVEDTQADQAEPKPEAEPEQSDEDQPTKAGDKDSDKKARPGNWNVALQKMQQRQAAQDKTLTTLADSIGKLVSKIESFGTTRQEAATPPAKEASADFEVPDLTEDELADYEVASKSTRDIMRKQAAQLKAQADQLARLREDTESLREPVNATLARERGEAAQRQFERNYPEIADSFNEILDEAIEGVSKRYLDDSKPEYGVALRERFFTLAEFYQDHASEEAKSTGNGKPVAKTKVSAPSSASPSPTDGTEIVTDGASTADGGGRRKRTTVPLWKPD